MWNLKGSRSDGLLGPKKLLFVLESLSPCEDGIYPQTLNPKPFSSKPNKPYTRNPNPTPYTHNSWVECSKLSLRTRTRNSAPTDRPFVVKSTTVASRCSVRPTLHLLNQSPTL